MNNDKLILGGHEFNSRFILGSGKYSLNLIEAAIKDAGAEIITLAVGAPIPKTERTFSILSRKTLPCCPTQAARETQRKRSELPNLRASWAAAIL